MTGLALPLLPDLAALAVPLLLAYLRMQAMVLMMPVLSERLLPARVRIAVAMALAPVALALSGAGPAAGDMTPGIFAILAAREIAVGLIIAVPVRIMAAALHIASSALGAAGSLSQLIGTGTEAAPHPIGNLLHLAGLAVLMAAGLPLLLVEMIAQGYRIFPAGGIAISLAPMAMVGLVARAFVVALALASPFILGGLLYQALLGVVSRVMPTLPVVFIGAPAIIMLALTGLAILSPAILSGWAQAVLDAAGWP
ncbi:MAG: flagellar biosynthetic protein FliR [Paracoccus sp. (in: a-proteobacteria)]|nr:flagellar biosynthetic protein FliR [Paracoccus sp. (in: a-proteobacteria)]